MIVDVGVDAVAPHVAPAVPARTSSRSPLRDRACRRGRCRRDRPGTAGADCWGSSRRRRTSASVVVTTGMDQHLRRIDLSSGGFHSYRKVTPMRQHGGRDMAHRYSSLMTARLTPKILPYYDPAAQPCEGVDMLTLYHGRTSVCSVKARLALVEKGVDFDSRLMTLRGDQFEPGYLKLNPNAVVPTIVHDGNVVIEFDRHHALRRRGVPRPGAHAGRSGRPRADAHVREADGRIHPRLLHDAHLRDREPRPSHEAEPQEMDEELAKAPDQKRSEIKRQVVTHGLDAPLVKDALRHHEKLFAMMETALASGPYLAGADWSLADAAATPYIWRLDKLKLAPLWDQRRRHRGLVRSHPRAAVVQAGGRRLGERGRSRALRQPARSLAEGVGASEGGVGEASVRRACALSSARRTARTDSGCRAGRAMPPDGTAPRTPACP